LTEAEEARAPVEELQADLRDLMPLIASRLKNAKAKLAEAASQDINHINELEELTQKARFVNFVDLIDFDFIFSASDGLGSDCSIPVCPICQCVSIREHTEAHENHLPEIEASITNANMRIAELKAEISEKQMVRHSADFFFCFRICRFLISYVCLFA
jgi:hypothetical protein